MNKATQTSREIRSIFIDSELKTSSRLVEGYGIVFDKESVDLGGFTEKILPSALEGVVERSDVLALMNHDINRGVLARCTRGIGSLKLMVDPKGVKYVFESPHTQLGDELVEGITRNDIKGSSFAFTIAEDGEQWEKRSDGSILRTISQFNKIYDMSPCYRESYQDTTIALRSLDEYNKNNDESSEAEVNPTIAKTIEENLADNQSIPTYSNAELAMRARNEMFKNN